MIDAIVVLSIPVVAIVGVVAMKVFVAWAETSLTQSFGYVANHGIARLKSSLETGHRAKSRNVDCRSDSVHSCPLLGPVWVIN